MSDRQALVKRAEAAEAEVERLQLSMLAHFNEEHLAGDGPEIDRWKRENARLRERAEELEREVQSMNGYKHCHPDVLLQASRKRAKAAEAKLAEAEAEMSMVKAERDLARDHVGALLETPMGADRDEWRDTARSEMAGRAAAEAEVERLRDIITPGDAAAYEEGMAALKIEVIRQRERAIRQHGRAEKAEGLLREMVAAEDNEAPVPRGWFARARAAIAPEVK